MEMAGRILGNELMDHDQAVAELVAERYLLDELTPEAREAFEEHAFDCQECALDLRAGAAFVDEAKLQLPGLVGAAVAAVPPVPSRFETRDEMRDEARPGRPGFGARLDSWLGWLRPAFAVPAFAALLLVVGFQNLVTLPALRAQVDQPRLLPWVALHGATRGAPIKADREHGVALPIDLASQAGGAAYSSYAFDLIDASGKKVWTGTTAAPDASDDGPQRVLLAIPGARLRSGAYTIAVSGAGARGEQAAIESYTFNLVMTD
jgi:hypothetical protein